LPLKAPTQSHKQTAPVYAGAVCLWKEILKGALICVDKFQQLNIYEVSTLHLLQPEH